MKKLFTLCLTLLPLTCFASEAAYERVEDRSDLKILSPTLSNRKTAKIRLANGLEAYLISDPEVDQSAAALAVNVGSWSDPVEYPGMAHFLEHMLFMGTKAYPKEFEYMQYVGDHGGKVNAYTASDRTVYIFSINNDGFEGAYDRFAHFFIDPLFLQACIGRELHAVDQEHAKNLEHDGWRQYMIYKETGNQNHPNAKFSTGNAETLGGIPQKAMKDWYNTHYSANKMHLVVLSNKPIGELIDLTVKDFSAVPKHATPTPTFTNDMTSERQKGSLIYVKPVKDIKTLSLTWELPANLAEDQDAKAGELLAYILKSGSHNSLLDMLKRKHLAEEISVSQDQFSKTNKLFSIDIALTDEGLQDLDQVITHCFEALARYRSGEIPDYIFNEYEKMETINYEYQSRTEAYLYVQEGAHKLVDEDLATFPRKSLLPTKHDPQMLAAYLDALSPENCLYFVLADPAKSGVPPTYKEKWMGAEYAIRPLSSKKLMAWSHVKTNPKIGLPPPNPFIPDNLHLVENELSEETVVPTLLQDDDNGKIYFSEDKRYQTPKVAHTFRIKSPLIDGSAKSKVLLDLYLKAAYDKLFPLLSAAQTAGFQVGLGQENMGLFVSVNGYSDRSERVTNDLFSGLRTVRPSRKQFALYQDSLGASYDNAARELPVLQSFELMNNILFSNAPTSLEKKEALQKISYEEFVQFTDALFKKTYVEGLLYGNLTNQEAKTLWTSLSKTWSSHSFPVREQKNRQILILPENSGPYMVTQTTPMQGNAAVLVIEQGPYSYDRRASQEVLGRVLKDGFFDTLRTKQQTAYIAKAWEKEEERQMLQFFAVQSSTHKPRELIARFELFLEDFLKQYTTKLPIDRFEKIRNMSISKLQMPPENLSLMGMRLFMLGFNYEGDFKLIDKRINALEELTYDQTQQAAREYLSRKNTRRIAILTEGAMAPQSAFHYVEVSKEDLQHHGTFVAWQPEL